MASLDYGKAICYSGYREGQSPVTKSYPSHDEIKEDLLLLTEYRYLRLYDASEHARRVVEVIKQENFHFEVMIGINLLGEISNPQCAWGGEYTDEEIKRNIAHNEQELQDAIALANQYPDIITVVSAGNEAIPEWNENLVSEERVLYFVNQLKKQTSQLVTYCENNHYWRTSMREIAQAVDIISVHTYPVWLSHSLEDSLHIAKNDYYEIRDMYPDKTVVITETGWPTQSSNPAIPQHHANEMNQLLFIDDMMNWSEQEEVIIYFFEAFDEKWKGSPNPLEPEKHWGLYDVKRRPKIFTKRKLKTTTSA